MARPTPGHARAQPHRLVPRSAFRRGRASRLLPVEGLVDHLGGGRPESPGASVSTRQLRGYFLFVGGTTRLRGLASHRLHPPGKDRQRRRHQQASRMPLRGRPPLMSTSSAVPFEDAHTPLDATSRAVGPDPSERLRWRGQRSFCSLTWPRPAKQLAGCSRRSGSTCGRSRLHAPRSGWRPPWPS